MLAPLTRRQFLGATAGLVVIGSGLAMPARGITINPRASWATNRPPKGPMESEDVRFLIVHHSASRNGHTSAEAPEILRSFYDYHTGAEKGWSDIAYNFLIDSEGGVWEGRAGSLEGPVAGDATGGNQGFTQLVCVIGDYNAVRPSQASLSSLVALLAWLSDRYDIPTTPGSEVTFTSRGSNRHPAGVTVTTPTITGHRAMSQTTCPGDNLNVYVATGLMADVETARDGLKRSPASAVPASSSTSITSPTITTMVPTTTTTSLATPAQSSTTLPIAVEQPSEAGPTGIVVTTGALVLTGAGLLMWRRRRMGGGTGGPD